MEKLNQRNWLYILRWFQLKKDEPAEVISHPPAALPDFECIRIRTLHLQVALYLKAPKVTVLEALGLRVNLYSMVGENRKKQMVKLLEEVPTNDRYTRWRAEGT